MTIALNFFIVIFIEILLAVGFDFFRKKYLKQENLKTNGVTLMSIVKGIFERILLSIALIYGFPHILTLFGALKLGTRLSIGNNENPSEKVKYNDYYLIGNFVSVLVSILYYNMFKCYLFTQP